MKQEYYIYLACGAILTLLFIVFREDLYNIFYYSTGFNDQLYNHGLYTTIPSIAVIVGWGTAAVYYYAINSVRFDRWWHWLVMLAVAAVLSPVLGLIANISAFNEAGLDYGSDIVLFEFGNMVLTALLFVVASFSMRWWSSNCRHTPFPQ